MAQQKTPTQPNQDQINDLFRVIEAGDLDSVKECLTRAPELLKAIDKESGWSALNAATFHGQEEVVKFLLSQGISLDIGGTTAVSIKAEEFAQVHLKTTIKTLISVERQRRQAALTLPIQQNVQTAAVSPSIASYGENDRKKFIELLDKTNLTSHDVTLLLSFLNQYPEFITIRGNHGQTPLHFAVLARDMGLIKSLVSRGCDVNQAMNNGDTPLHFAAQLSREDIAEFLVRLGADPHKGNTTGLTPADLAEKNKHPALANSLRKATSAPAIPIPSPAKSTLAVVAVSTPLGSGVDLTTQKLFKHDQENQQNNIKAILLLKEILDLINKMGEHSKLPGSQYTTILYNKFPEMFSDLKLNQLDTFEVAQLISQLTTVDCQRRLIILFTERLMNISYKYGRQNLEKEPFHLNCAYLTNIGLLTLARELLTHPEFSNTALFQTIIKDIKQEFPCILEFFFRNQLLQPININAVPLEELSNQCEILQLHIEKSRMVMANFACEQLQTSQPQLKSKEKLTEAELLVEKLKQLTALKEAISNGSYKLPTPKIEDVIKIIKQIQDYQALKTEEEILLEQRKDLIKLAQNWRQDISHMQSAEEKSRKIQIMQNQNRPDENIEPIRKELASYKVLSAKEIDAQAIQLDNQKQLVLRLEKELAELRSSRSTLINSARSNRSLAGTAKTAELARSNIEQASREEQTVAKLDAQIKTKLEELNLQKSRFSILKSQLNIDFARFRLQHQSLSLAHKQQKLLQVEQQLNEVDSKLSTLQTAPQVIFIPTLAELQQQTEQLESKRSVKYIYPKQTE